jgi:hypothetical protein
VLAKGSWLELVRPDETGQLVTVHATPAFGSVRQLSPFRFPGGDRDYVIATSDSGKTYTRRRAAEQLCWLRPDGLPRKSMIYA